MGLEAVEAEWLGGNLVTSGIPDLTLLPPSTRLQFSSGATLVVDMENAPCRQVADVIAGHKGEAGLSFVKHATHKRGITAWVEREGGIGLGDSISLILPPQRHWGDHAPRMI
jgi:MOSC domain-containing protein YiiM